MAVCGEPGGHGWTVGHPCTLCTAISRTELPVTQPAGSTGLASPQTSLAVVQLDWLSRLGQFCRLRQHGQFSEGTGLGSPAGIQFWVSVSKTNPAPAAPFLNFPVPSAPLCISRLILSAGVIFAHSQQKHIGLSRVGVRTSPGHNNPPLTTVGMVMLGRCPPAQ
eukprot:gene10440-biopygen10824